VTQIGEDIVSEPRAARASALAFGIGGGIAVLGLLLLFLPIDWSEAKLRFRLWKAGARPVLWEKHRGFTQDRCAGHPPAECGCVWFIHGLGDSVVTWRNFFLEPDAFGKTPVRVYAIDLPGHGGSLKRHDLKEYRVLNIARELDAGIAQTKECTRNALVGNSFGGWVAARLAIDFPKHYSAIILISPTGLASVENETKDLFKSPTVESLKEFQRRAYFKPRILSNSEWSLAAQRMKSSSSEEVRGAQTPADRLDGSLGKITAPTFLIWGEADQIVSRPAMGQFNHEIPHSELSTLAECGHLPQKECPATLFPLVQHALAASHSAP
jgi:pimeloyl-ACP methyl ester carboxylesterase